MVVFDLDGTLADSQAGIAASYRHTLAGFGLDAGDDEIRACIGPPLADGLARLGVPGAALTEAVATYRRYFSLTGIYANTPYPAIPSTLLALYRAGLTLALATSKRDDFAGRVLELLGLDHLFSAVAGATEDGTRTTKTEIVAHVLDRLGRPDPATVTVVGDRADDLLAAAALGTTAIAVTWGYGSREELEGAGAAVLADHPAELIGLLTGTGPGPAPRLS